MHQMTLGPTPEFCVHTSGALGSSVSQGQRARKVAWQATGQGNPTADTRSLPVALESVPAAGQGLFLMADR